MKQLPVAIERVGIAAAILFHRAHVPTLIL